MIDLEQLVDFIKTTTPVHFRGICSSLKSLTDELECTKRDLSKMLISAQNQDNFSRALEILDAQEALAKTISEYMAFLHEIGIETTDQQSKNVAIIPQEREKDNGTLAPLNLENHPVEIDNGVEIISIDNGAVTILKRKPMGFSFNGSFYKVRTWKEVLLKTCEILYYHYPEVFHGFIDNAELPGRKFVFSFEKDDLRQPAKIDNADFWIHTKLGAEEIRGIILHLFECCNVQRNTMNLYLMKNKS